MVAEYEAAAGLLAQLQALGGGPLWPCEAASLTAPRAPSERSIVVAVRFILYCDCPLAELLHTWHCRPTLET